jgi:hypothetical protein
MIAARLVAGSLGLAAQASFVHLAAAAAKDVKVSADGKTSTVSCSTTVSSRYVILCFEA